MKKILLSCLLLFVAAVSQAKVGDDLTSKHLVNADFSQGTVVDNGICTYDYDMEKNSTTYYGQQAVDGWTALTLTDNTWIEGRTDGLNARAAGLFGLSDPIADSNPFLGGGSNYAPEVSSTGAETGQMLGLIAVWGAQLQYTQDVTFPAGAYTIHFDVYNSSGTTEVAKNLFGFIAEDGTAYTCTERAWGNVAEWNEMSVTFYLEQETSGVISLGYASANAGSGAMPHLFIDKVSILEADAAAIIKEKVDALKESGLLPLLEDGDELGVNTKNGWAVFNNDNATLEEVQKAIAEQKEINEKGMTDFTDYFINNAHFNEGTPQDGGVCTYDYDMPGNNARYFGMQAIEKWIASSPSDNVQKMANSGDKANDNPLNSRASGLFAVGSGEEVWLGSVQDKVPATKANGSAEGNVFGFISVWSGTAYYYQHVTLPAGNYTITIPTYNERGTGAINKNMCGFIADSGEEYLAETKTFPEGAWHNETIKFALDEDTPGKICIGYVAANAGSGSMPHLFVDEFLLKYNGTIDEDPSLIALRGAVTSAEEFEAVCDASILDNLHSAISKGASLVNAGSNDVDANVAAATEINNLLAEAQQSAVEYAKFKSFIEGDLQRAIDKYAEGDLSSLSSELESDRDEYLDAYDAGSYNSVQIVDAMGGLKEKIYSAVQSAFDSAASDGAEHNLDISILFNNLDYANSTVEGWQNETGTGAFLSRVQTAEVWNQNNFNVYQTLADMPAGAYEIKANGFYRTAANIDNYAEWENKEVSGSAYLYAGETKVLMHNVAEIAAEKDDWHTAGVDGEGDAASLYVPNSNDNAHVAFYNNHLCENSVVTALTEAGDLTLGIKGENLSSNAWVVWGAVSVIFKGWNEELILSSLDAQIDVLEDKAMEMQEDEIVSTVALAISKLEKACDAGEAAKDSQSSDVKTAAIETLKEALAYAMQSQPLKEQLLELHSFYSELPNNIDITSTDKKFQALLNEIDPEGDVKSNEQIQEWIDALPVAWAGYVFGQSSIASASEKAPADVTAVILNPGFEGIDEQTPGASYWNVTRDGGNEGYQFGVYEFYNNNSADINQTIKGLKEGYYRVKVQGFYRAGDNATNAASLAEDPSSIAQSYLYAGANQVAMKNVLDLEDVEGYVAGEGMGVGSEPTVSWNGNDAFIVPNNREALAAYFEAGLYWNEVECQVGKSGVLTLGISKPAHVASDWLPYDNFQLYYLGTTAPTAVENVAAQSKSAIYDLQGRKVSKAQKGLYIVNGKVVVVK